MSTSVDQSVAKDGVVLWAQGLTRRFGARLALTGFDLELRKGEVVGLLGTNGAGKTTALRLLSGTLAPQAGELRICARDGLRRGGWLRAHTGYLPDRPPLYPEMTVSAYLAFCAAIHGVPRQRRAQAVETALQRCDLHEVGARQLGNLSQGYRQRVGIAQAIVHGPTVVILDEPTSGLDPRQLRQVRELIAVLRADHALLLSSHILSEVQAVCDRVVVVHRGRVVHRGAVGATTPALGPVVRFERALSQAQLDAVPGLSAHPLPGQRWQLELADADVRDTLLRTALDRGWGLVEWMPADSGLERLFLELTQEK